MGSWDALIHVDAASGGFVAPYLYTLSWSGLSGYH